MLNSLNILQEPDANTVLSGRLALTECTPHPVLMLKACREVLLVRILHFGVESTRPVQGAHGAPGLLVAGTQTNDT